MKGADRNIIDSNGKRPVDLVSEYIRTPETQQEIRALLVRL